MPQHTSLSQAFTYPHIDDVLAPPPARLMRRAHFILLSIAVLIAALLWLVRYSKQKTFSVQVRPTPASSFYADEQGFQVRKVLIQKDTSVLIGEPLLIVNRKIGSSPDTVGAMTTGWLSWIRLPSVASVVGSGTVLFAIQPQSSPQEFCILLPQDELPDSLFTPGRKLQLHTSSGRELRMQLISRIYPLKLSGQWAVDARLLPGYDLPLKADHFEPATVTVNLGSKRLIGALFD